MDNKFEPSMCGHMREVKMADARHGSDVARHSNTYTNLDMVLDVAHLIRRAIEERFPFAEDSLPGPDSTHTLSSVLRGIAGGVVIGTIDEIRDSRLFQLLSALSEEARLKLGKLLSGFKKTP